MTMTRVLMVCVGNVCRSPLAERMLAARAAAAGLDLEVGSAGVDALVGDPIDASAAAELTRSGGSALDFAARQLTPALVAEADLVLTATKDVRVQVLRVAPAAMRRTFTLVEFAALCAEGEGESSVSDLIAGAARRRARVGALDLDVTDPFRRDAEMHRAVARQLEEAVAVIATRLADCTDS